MVQKPQHLYCHYSNKNKGGNMPKEKIKGLICTKEEGMTKQCFKDECDINKIMEKYIKTGQLPALQEKDPSYGDFTTLNDFQEAQELIIKANDQFEALPAAIRDRFQNDPEQFIAFVENPDNLEEMIKLGVATKKEDIKPTPTPDPKPKDNGGQ